MISIRPLTLDSAPRLIEEDGIGYLPALAHERDAPSAEYDASKNEVSIEAVAARPVNDASTNRPLQSRADAVYQHNQTDLEFLLTGPRSAASYTLFLPDGTPCAKAAVPS